MVDETYISHSVTETERLGYELGETLTGGDVVALSGGLGVGKTAFVRGIAAGLGFSGFVGSPTFTLVNEYLNGAFPLFHFDFYRLDGINEILGIGWDDYADRGGICIIEWSERCIELFADDTICVDIRFGEFRDDRIVRISRRR